MLVLETAILHSKPLELTVHNVLAALPVPGLDLQAVFTPSDAFKMDICALLALVLGAGTELEVKDSKSEHVSLQKEPFTAREKLDLSFLSDEKHSPILAHVISMLLNFLERNHFYNLSLSSTQILIHFFTLFDADRIAQFMPGVLSSISRALSRNDKEHHLVLCHCIRLTRVIIAGSLGDNVSESLLCPVSQVARKSSTKVNPMTENFSTKYTQEMNYDRKSIKIQDRDHEWFKLSTTNISHLLPSIISFRIHSHHQVRLAVAKFCATLLTDCAKSLKTCNDIITETLVLLVSDTNSIVMETSRDYISKLLETQSSHLFKGKLSTNLSKRLASFPKDIQKSNDEDKWETLQKINGYLQILKHNASVPINLNTESIARALIWLVTPNLTNVKMVEERVHSEIEDFSNIEMTSEWFPRREFVHFHEERVFDAFRAFCKLLTVHGNSSSLTQHLYTLLNTPSVSQAMFILNECMKNAKDSPDGSNWIVAVLSQYLLLPHLSQPTDLVDFRLKRMLTIEPKSMAPTISETNQVIVNISLFLEGVSIAAHNLPPKDISLFLMDGLYPILEKFGDSNLAVSSSASSALLALAHGSMKPTDDPIAFNPLVHLKNSSSTRANMVLMHVDYLIDSVSHNLRFIREHPLAPKVLVAAIKVVGSDIVGPLMSDCVDQIIDLLEDFGVSGYVPGVGATITQEDDDAGIVGELLNVFFALLQVMTENPETGVEAILQSGVTPQVLLLDSDPISNDVLLNASSEMQAFYIKNKKLDPEALDESPESAEQFFTDMISKAKDTKRTEGEVNPDDVFDDPESSANIMTSQKDGDIPPTQYEALAFKILSRSLYFLSSDSPQIRMAVLKMFQMGLSILSKSPQLNPLIHSIWPTLLNRCQDSRHYVAIDALVLVKVIAENSKDFVRKRVKDSILSPFLSLLLKLQSSVSKRYSKSSKSGAIVKSSLNFISPLIESRVSENHMLLTLFSTLKVIIQCVPINSLFSDQFAEIMVRFLDAQMYSKEVKKEAQDILHYIAKNCGTQWINILVWSALGSPIIPSPVFPLVSLKSIPSLNYFRSTNPQIINYEPILKELGLFGTLVKENYKAALF